MKAKYAKLIERLEQATEAYSQALDAAKKFKAAIDCIDGVLGVQGPFDYINCCYISRSIHVTSDCFAEPALECGTDFKMEHLEHFTRFDCSMFGYRVFALFKDGERGYAELLKKVKADE